MTQEIYIAEARYARGELETTPEILKIDVNGTISSFVDRHLYGPIERIIRANCMYLIEEKYLLSIFRTIMYRI
jgi:hypothetical protein